MNSLMQTVTENLIFVLEFLGIVAAMVVVAYVVERMEKKKDGRTERTLTTRKIAMVGVFSAIATILYMMDFAVPFAPGFYKMDFSELPALIGAFAFGPVASVMIEFCKIVLKLLFKGTSTAFVGDLANFVIGCSFLLPASIVYLFHKTKRNAIVGCVAGTVVLTVFGTAFNAIYLLPAFSKLYGTPLESLLAMGTAVNPLAKEGSIVSFVAACVAPLNLIKGASVSLVTLLIYKPLSPIIKTGHRM